MNLTRVLPAAATVAAAVATGCSGSAEAPERTAAAIVAAAVERSDSASSYRAEIRTEETMDGDHLQTSGTFVTDARSERLHGTVDVERSPAGPFRFETIVVDRRQYLKGDIYGLPPGHEWMRLSSGDATSQPTMTPGEMVELLRDSPDVDKVGVERIRDKTALHLRGPFDFAEMARRGPDGPMTRRMRANPEIAERIDASVDAWISEQDDRLHRIRLVVRVDGAEVSRVQSDIVAEDVDLSAAVAPPESTVIDEKDLDAGR